MGDGGWEEGKGGGRCCGERVNKVVWWEECRGLWKRGRDFIGLGGGFAGAVVREGFVGICRSYELESA